MLCIQRIALNLPVTPSSFCHAEKNSPHPFHLHGFAPRLWQCTRGALFLKGWPKRQKP